MQAAAADAGSGIDVVLAAMREEVAPLLARLEDCHPVPLDDAGAVEGKLGGVPVVVAWSGDGAAQARRGIAAVLDRWPARRLLVLGVAGGLTPDLPECALVLVDRIVDGGSRVPAPDPRWAGQAREVGDLAVGPLFSSPRMLCSREEKAQAREQFGFETAAMVDLESAVFARAAGERGIPFLVIRAVSDPADESLPIDFNACVDAHGRISRGRVIRRALARPAAMRGLWRLRGRLNRCAAGLADHAERLLVERTS